MIERLRHMLRKEWIQLFRDPRARMFLFGAPIIQLIMFGYAVTTDVRDVATAVLDRDEGVLSRDFVARFARSGYFDVERHVASMDEASALIDRGTVLAVLVVDDDFSEVVAAGRTATVQLILDGSDSNTARIVLSYALKIADQFSRERARAARLKRGVAAGVPAPSIAVESRAWFNENLESRNYFVPGVIVLIVTLLTLMLTSMAIVREKELGTIEQIIVSPMRPIEFILGKTIPFAIVGFIDVILVTLVGVFWFEIPIRGSIALLLGATGLYLLTTLGVGLLISTISRTQQQAMMSTFFFFMPGILLSGLMFPITNMPEVAQWLTYANPMRYFLLVVRSIFLKGTGLAVLWPQLAALGALGLITFTVASLRFRKTLA